MDEKNASNSSPENHSADDYEPFPLDFSEWTLVDDISGDDDNCFGEDDAHNRLLSGDFPKSSSAGSNGNGASDDSVFVNETDSHHTNKEKPSSSNFKKKLSAGVTIPKIAKETSRIYPQNKSKTIDLNGVESKCIKSSGDNVAHAASNNVAKGMKGSISNNAKVETISKFPSKGSGKDGGMHKATAVLSNKQSALQKQHQVSDLKKLGNDELSNKRFVNKSKGSVSGQGAEHRDFTDKTLQSTELETFRTHSNESIADIMQNSKSIAKCQKSYKEKTRKLEIKMKAESPNPKTRPPLQNTGSLTQQCRGARSAEVKNTCISKLHSKAVANDQRTQKPTTVVPSDKQSTVQKQTQCKKFGNNGKTLTVPLVNKNNNFVRGQEVKSDFKEKTVVETGQKTFRTDPCRNKTQTVQTSKFFEVQKSEDEKPNKGNKRKKNSNNDQPLKSNESEKSESKPPQNNNGPLTQMCQEAHSGGNQTLDSTISRQLPPKQAEIMRATEISAGRQHFSCSAQKRKVGCFNQTAEADAKRFMNKFVHCGNKQPAIRENPPLEQCTPVGNQHEQYRNLRSQSSELPNFDFPKAKTVSREIFNMVFNFEVSNSFSSLSPLENFDYGLRVGYLLSSDVDKISFRDTFIKKADSYNLFFASHDSGVLDLFFNKEENLANVVNHIRKARLGLRHLCCSIYKKSNEKDSNGEVSVNFLKATIIFDQNFISSAYLSYYKQSIWNKPKVDEYITIHNIPEGIPLSFLSFIFPDAITIELDDVNLKCTKWGCRVKLGMNHKTYPEHFKDLFCQVLINDVPVFLTHGVTEGKDIPEMKVKVDLQEKLDDLKERNPKEKDSRKILNTVTVVKDKNANDKENRAIEVKEKVVTDKVTSKSPVSKAEQPPPEDIIDLTEEPSSPLRNFSENLSEISNSSFNSDDLDGPLYSSSDDERSSQPHGKMKSSKTFDRLYEKYVLKKRKKERREKRHRKVKDIPSSSRTKRIAEKSRNLSPVNESALVGKKELASPTTTESRNRKRRRKNGKRTRKDGSITKLSDRDEWEHGNILKHGGSNSPPAGKTQVVELEPRTSQKMSSPQEKGIAESSRSPPRQCDPFSFSNSRQIIRVKSDSKGSSEERDLRFTLDSIKSRLHAKKTKESRGEASESSVPSFRSLLGECLSQVNRKRHPSRSPSPTPRKVLLVKRSYSTNLPLEEGEVVDSSDDSVTDRDQKMGMEESLQDSSQISSKEIRDQHDDHVSAEAKDNVVTERHQHEPENNPSQEQFTISKSLLVTLMRQIITKDAPSNVDQLLTSESIDKKKDVRLKTLDLVQGADLKTSSIAKDKETVKHEEDELMPLQNSSKSLIDNSIIEKMSETKSIPVVAQKQEFKTEIKPDPQNESKNLTSHEPPSKFAVLPPPIPPSELPNLPPPIPPSELSTLPPPIPPSELSTLPPPIPPSELSTLPPPIPPSELSTLPPQIPPSELSTLPPPIPPSELSTLPPPIPPSELSTLPPQIPPSELSSLPPPIPPPELSSLPPPIPPSELPVLPPPKPPSELPFLPPPIPPSVDPSILTSLSVPTTSENPCPQSETSFTMFSSDPLDTSFSEGGVWMAPPAMSMNTSIYQEPLSTIPLSSMSTALPTQSHIPPTILQPPMMHPMAFIAPSPFHPDAFFPPQQLQAPQGQQQGSLQNEMIPISGVWQTPPQGHL